MPSERRRIWISRIMLALCGLAAGLSAAILVVLLLYVLVKGIAYVNLEFLTALPRPLGEPGGGMANAFVGSAVMVGLATLWATLLAVGAGIYLAEYGGERTVAVVRLVADVLSGLPSIVIGVFAYTLLVKPLGTFSAVAGAFALGLIMLPIVARTTEESLRLVPHELREAALALGIPRWRATLSVLLPTARAGILTGVMLAVARIAGETAPLLFTALGNRFWPNGLLSPTAALTLNIYQYAISPYDQWHQQAWAAAFFLLLFVLVLNIVARLVAARAMPR
ncbi:MAG TPA: phosphate ABC transporter permease PstA [Chloroflexota bacterium]|jgi:phosphate transport system permease protein|nr:phosphate ABC transporter permease PstA [Chloroflexota bacterium]